GFPADVRGLFLTRSSALSQRPRLAPASRRAPAAISEKIGIISDAVSDETFVEVLAPDAEEERAGSPSSRQGSARGSTIRDHPPRVDRVEMRYRSMRDDTLQQAWLFRYPRAPAPGGPVPPCRAAETRIHGSGSNHPV